MNTSEPRPTGRSKGALAPKPADLDTLFEIWDRAAELPAPKAASRADEKPAA